MNDSEIWFHLNKFLFDSKKLVDVKVGVIIFSNNVWYSLVMNIPTHFKDLNRTGLLANYSPDTILDV
ncbi:hypothetical protein BLOT_015132 [Blomia tropicalis]|nr:hypothetical protein BLOT_015132 [Blomia tropicalis]